MKTGIGSHTREVRGQTDDWITPKPIIDALGPFDLDPCCPPAMPWKTAESMVSDRCLAPGAPFAHVESRGVDGLLIPWGGRVWLNPPYGQQTAAWLEALAKHGRGTALIFARTETAMFFEHVWRKATALLFIEGRLHFHYPDGKRAKGNAGGPSVLVAYGDSDAETLRDSGLRGAFVHLKE